MARRLPKVPEDDAARRRRLRKEASEAAAAKAAEAFGQSHVDASGDVGAALRRAMSAKPDLGSSWDARIGGNGDGHGQ